VQEVNWSRKNNQTAMGDKLRYLESSWVGLVSKNYEIEQALVRMEAELRRMEDDNQATTETA
jgi:pre-mRNA-splicing factor SPF27